MVLRISHPTSLVTRLFVDEPVLGWIMTQDNAKGMCASELGPLTIKDCHIDVSDDERVDLDFSGGVVHLASIRRRH